MKHDLITPSFQTKPYKASKCIAIKDRWQQFLYIKHLAYPIDMYVDSNENLVMVFNKEETKDLYKAYREYKLS